MPANLLSENAPRIATPPPPPLDLRPIPSVVRDVRRARRVRRRGGLPPGSQEWSLRNLWILLNDPLRLLLQHYEEYGPVFTIRTMHDPVVWGIGPEVNQQVLLTEPEAFRLRDSQYADLAPLFGDGLLLTDGEYPREIRKVVLPELHRERLADVAGIAIEETTRAVAGLQPGLIDIEEWARATVLGIALRVIFGLDADPARDARIREAFEIVAAMWGRLFFATVMQFGRWPNSPYDRAVKARSELDRFIYDEIDRRRSARDPGRGMLGLLVAATDGEGRPLPAKMVRDQLVTLLFGGHDTSTGALTFLLYELGRNPGPRADLEAELDERFADRLPTPEDLDGSALPVLERTIDETLRRYPTAWAGPRRTVRDVVVAGVPVPAETGFNYSSWATHHLSEIYEDPLAFRPDRFLPENRKQIPRGGYLPFGLGARTCVGMRLALLVIRTAATVVLPRFRVEVHPGYPVKVSAVPTLRVAGQMPCRIRARHDVAGGIRRTA